MNRRKLHRLSAVLMIGPALGACIFFEGPVSRQMQHSPNFKAGYSDGCSTASASTANYREDRPVYKDEALFKSDKAYRAGWAAGYTSCRPMMMNTEPKSGPIADPYPPH